MTDDRRYRVEKGFETQCMYVFRAPFSDGKRVRLPEGLIIQPDPESVPEATALHATPLPESAWEMVFAPDVRRTHRYVGYSLVIDKIDLERYCQPASDVCPVPEALMNIDAFTGCLLGTAVGDALGLPFDSIGPRRMQRFHALPLRHRLVLGRGLLSDDTEHACLNAQALARSGGDPEVFLPRLAWGLRFWLLALPAGIGLGTLRALIKLLLGVSPARSGVFSAGNGPLMRAPILGVFAADTPDRLRELVRISTRITHHDPRAEHAASCVAEAAALSASGESVEPNLFLASQRRDDDQELNEILSAIESSLDRSESAPTFAATRDYERGVPGYCHATLAVVLHAWLSHSSDFDAALSAVVECGGDTDTTGAILGGIVGAGVGPEGIPTVWREGVADWPRSMAWIETLAREVAYTKLSGLQRYPVAAPLPLTLVRNLLFIPLVLAHGLRRLLPPY